MAIVPETKSWTWVLERRCPECGFDAAAVARDDLGRSFRENAAAWPAVLARPDVRQRPRADVWSPLEYACHVRDVLRIGAVRLALLRDEDDPLFANWDQDATAVDDDYPAQDPVVVARELTEAVVPLADALEAVEDWDRAGRRSDGAAFTTESLGRYLLHDPVHHLWDVAPRP